jgi:hypothetical protein
LTSLYIPGETIEPPLMLLIATHCDLTCTQRCLSLRFQSLGLAYGGDVLL